MNIFDSLSPTEILALTIIGEARGEPIEGQVAVGSVIRNRMIASPHKYRNLGAVCLEPKQFSCWNEDDPNRALLLDIGKRIISGDSLEPSLKQCLFIAHGIDTWSIMDNTKGAVNYMTTALFHSDKRPKWAMILDQDPIHLGKQVFFSV